MTEVKQPCTSPKLAFVPNSSHSSPELAMAKVKTSCTALRIYSAVQRVLRHGVRNSQPLAAGRHWQRYICPRSHPRIVNHCLVLSQ